MDSRAGGRNNDRGLSSLGFRDISSWDSGIGIQRDRRLTKLVGLTCFFFPFEREVDEDGMAAIGGGKGEDRKTTLHKDIQEGEVQSGRRHRIVY